MIAMNKPAIAGTKYRSAIDGAIAGCDVAVGAAGSTTNDDTACDGQYDSLPPKEA